MRYDALTVRRRLEALNLPNIWLDAAPLQLAQRLDHEPRPELPVETLLAAAALKLLGRRGNEQLEEKPPRARVEPLRERGQPLRLPQVQLAISLGVVANQHLAKVGFEVLDVMSEFRAVLKLEFRLSGSLDRHREQETARLGLACHLGAELFVDEDAAERPRRAARDRFFEPLEDDLFRIGDLGENRQIQRLRCTEEPTRE